MARADLLLALVRASAAGDAATFRRSLEAVIAEERGKQHHVLADRLAEYLSVPHQQTSSSSATANGWSPGNGVSQYLLELRPRLRLDDLILLPETSDAIRELIEEQARQDLLRAHGLEPRHKLLLAGPPGNGKTSLAEALADALALPFLVLRYEGVVGSYLGETATRLSRVFDAARTRSCVLFLDEFDTLGKERGDTHDTGEVKRVVSSLLLQIDALPAYVVVVAATNHPELLDRAVWRRFDLRLDLGPPGRQQLEQWVDRFELRLEISLGPWRSAIIETFRGASYSALESFALDVLRRMALNPDATAIDVIRRRLRLSPEAAVHVAAR